MAGISAPEPYRDPPPYPPPERRRPQDPHRLARDHAEDQSTEFGFGAGLIPRHLNGRPPSEGGQYMGRSPRVDPPRSGVGKPRQHRRPRDEVRGYPGEQIAR